MQEESIKYQKTSNQIIRTNQDNSNDLKEVNKAKLK
jgi:hypothetical protein